VPVTQHENQDSASNKWQVGFSFSNGTLGLILEDMIGFQAEISKTKVRNRYVPSPNFYFIFLIS